MANHPTAETRRPRQVAAEPEVQKVFLKDDGVFPNSKLPLLVYRKTVDLSGEDPAAIFEKILKANQWTNSWRNGIYPFHHYHSISHEALGVYRGRARVQLGGDNGVVQEIQAGDLLVIPAGVAHKNLGCSGDFSVVGAYPEGRDWDMNYGRPGERPAADQNISQVPLPRTDPLYGADGPLVHKWGSEE